MFSATRLYSSRIRPAQRWICLVKQSNHIQSARRLLSTVAVEDTPKFKILFFGRDEFSCGVFRELASAHEVWQSLDIVTNPDERVGRRGSQLSVSPLKLLGRELTHRTPSNSLFIHEIPPDRASFRTWEPPPSFSNDLPGAPSPHHLLITASFGRILPSRLLAHFRPERALNVHPSLLPALRGPAPIQRALATGVEKTGVCVIGMTKVVKKGVIDVGDVWAREEMPVSKGVAFPEMRDALAQQGGRLLVNVLRDMLKGQAKATPQSAFWDDCSGPPPYAPFITADDARVPWESNSASQIINMHNAISHQRALFTHLPDGETTLQLHSPSIAPYGILPGSAPPGTAIFDSASRTLVVRCASEEDVAFAQVKIQDKKLVPAKDFWNGVREGWWERCEGKKVVKLRS